MTTSKPDSKSTDVKLTPDRRRLVIGTRDGDLQLHLLQQARGALWLREEMSEKEVDETVDATLVLLAGIAPTSEIEGMLAVQMVGTHEAAMECLRRAMLQDQTFEGRDQNLKHATKLLATYERQLTALNKHRGKGQQKVTVKHVHVHEGGQAIVGEVHGSSATIPAPETHRPAMEAPRETPIDMTNAANLATEPAAVPVDAAENKEATKRQKRRPAP